MVKPCIKCGTPKEYSSWCRPCKQRIQKEIYHRDPERHRAYTRKYREKNPDVDRQWYIRNREAKLEANRQWYAANPDAVDIKKHRRRTLENGCKGEHTAAEWKAVLNKHRHRCANCGVTGKMTKDHIIPLARGGTNFAFNLAPLCRRCNSSKRDKIATGAQFSIFDNLGETG